eukprot:NODE_133_length_18153_cov_0.298050.p4 type:complete len:434 gc:universal NODE_133_length_18153_cov_0.298050:1726-3027(+)
MDSLLSKDHVLVLAESLGLSVDDSVAAVIANDVEYRVRQIIQDSRKFQVHSKSPILMAEDINSALSARNSEPIYGFVSPATFKSIPQQSLYYLHDEEIDLEQLLRLQAPKLPPPISWHAHWLAVEGQQPMIPENPLPSDVKASTFRPAVEEENKTLDTVIKPMLSHVMTKEASLYYEKIISYMSQDQKAVDFALQQVKSDGGLQQMLPYFIRWICDQIQAHFHNFKKLNNMIEFTKALYANPELFIEPYLHQFLPLLLSCVLAKSVASSGDHWALRRNAATVVHLFVAKYSVHYPTLKPRLAKTFMLALLDSSKCIATKYGAILGINIIGAEAVRVLLIPNLPKISEDIEASMEDDKEKLKSELIKSIALNLAHLKKTYDGITIKDTSSSILGDLKFISNPSIEQFEKEFGIFGKEIYATVIKTLEELNRVNK